MEIATVNHSVHIRTIIKTILTLQELLYCVILSCVSDHYDMQLSGLPC